MAASVLPALLASARPALAQNPAITITVDAASSRRAIDPNIYGIAFASQADLLDLRAPLNRWGGNASSRHNWEQDDTNRGADWYFESIPDSARVNGQPVPGKSGDDFVTLTKAAGAEPGMTLPMVGWVGKRGPVSQEKLWSFSIAKYGPQTGNDGQWLPDAGNGVVSNGPPTVYVTGNDPSDANVPADSSFQQRWVQHLIARWGLSGAGGVKYYFLDNEHAIWHSTHRDVHPTGAGMDEIKAKMVDYAGRVKDNDPAAMVVGPEEFGWSPIFYSGYDLQYCSLNGWSGCALPDRTSHGGWDYLPWLLDQIRMASQAQGRRLLDVFTDHWYPQSGEYSNDVSTGMQDRRNRSTRSLWDPAYVDESWIADVAKVIPRMRTMVNTYYPGTKIGITEYSWGAEDHINGATTQADLLGIFGREGLDMATRWTTPAASTPSYKAMKMYRNYDGAGSGFGDTRVGLTSTANADDVSSFAALRQSDGALTVMVVAKRRTGSTPATIQIGNFTAGSVAGVWQLTSANAIQNLANAPITGGQISASLPAQSITLFIVPAAAISPATLAINDVTVTEGTGGATTATFTVTRGGSTTGTVTVGYASVPATAVAGSDYTSATGTLTFGPGVTSRPVDVSIVTDALDEPTERFYVDLSGPSGATLLRSRGTATIVDDDGGNIGLFELGSGHDQRRDFSGPAAHLYLMAQDPYASYEVSVEDAFGSAGAPAGVGLDRLAADASTVLQSGVAPGPGAVRTLRWENATGVVQDAQYVRVRNNACPCTTADGYRIRVHETTSRIARFNNAGSQTTVIIVQNATAQPVSGHLWFWSASGALLHAQPFTTAGHALYALNSSGVPALVGAAGSVTVTHDGAEGALAGKAVSLEPSTGFSFDSVMQPRP